MREVRKEDLRVIAVIRRITLVMLWCVRKDRNHTGFTLIELLVVIAIIAILAAILYPVFLRAKQRGQIIKCMAHLRQCGSACILYTDDWDGRFPVGRITDMNGNIMSSRTWPEGQCVGGNTGKLETGVPYSPPFARPLNKYIKSIEFFHCKFEHKQDCAGTPNTFPWIRFGSSYNFNCTFHYPDPGGFFHTLVIPTGKSAYPEMYMGRRVTELKKPGRMIMMGERTIHYWAAVAAGQANPVPRYTPPFLGHANEQPYTPVVFCDGHVAYIKMTPGLSGDKWALAQKGWCPGAAGMGD